jgi:HTH-type transcriptional regulator/antitoxin HigA
MEQLGLVDADMVHYIGSKSKVSEVLSGKTPLTLKMIRTLQKELGIPAKVLIQSNIENEDVFKNIHLDIIKEIKNRGYLNDFDFKEDHRTAIVSRFFSQLNYTSQNFGALLRQTNYRTSPTTNKQALAAWLGCVLYKAQKVKVQKKYKAGSVNLNFMRELVKLSVEEKAPLLAQKFLLDNGVILIIEKQFEKTKLDGAAIFLNKDNPIIGLTLRYDRLDNFWFTLMHELAHVALHMNNDSELFYDELDEVKGRDVGIVEREADHLAGEALVPTEKWEISPAKLIPSNIAAASLAKKLGVHVAIVAGRMRFERDYKRLSKVVGEARVREYFSEFNTN